MRYIRSIKHKNTQKKNSLFEVKPKKWRDEILKLKSYMLNPDYYSRKMFIFAKRFYLSIGSNDLAACNNNNLDIDNFFIVIYKPAENILNVKLQLVKLLGIAIHWWRTKEKRTYHSKINFFILKKISLLFKVPNKSVSKIRKKRGNCNSYPLSRFNQKSHAQIRTAHAYSVSLLLISCAFKIWLISKARK